MTARLVIHLGDHKTGSTSIQAALRAGGEGFFYPSTGNHNALAKALIRGEGGADKRFQAIAEKLAASDAEIGVISAERFEAVPPRHLMAALKRHFPRHLATLSLIAYVRPHAERVLSSYAERIKGGYFAGDLAAFHEKTAASGEFLYLPRFSRWREVFGERFHLRPMIRDRLKDRDVVADFMDFALAGCPARRPDPGTGNASLCLEDLSLIRDLQMRLGEQTKLSPERRNMIGWRLAEHLATLPVQGTKLALDRTLAAEIRASYAGDAAALDQAFFDGSPMLTALNAAGDSAVDVPQSIDAADHHDAATRRQIGALSALLAGLLVAEAAKPASEPRARPPRRNRK